MSPLPHARRAGAARIQVSSLSRKAMQGGRAQEPAFTLYQLLVSLVVLVIAVSLALAYHHSRHRKPFFADLERLETEWLMGFTRPAALGLGCEAPGWKKG